MGQLQTQQLLATCHQLLKAYSSTAGGDAAQQRLDLQEQYLSTSAALRQTLQQCQELESAAAAAQQASTSASDESDPEVQQLRTRAEELRLRLEDRNALIKAAIDRLRQLLDALCMWDSSRRELQATAG